MRKKISVILSFLVAIQSTTGSDVSIKTIGSTSNVTKSTYPWLLSMSVQETGRLCSVILINRNYALLTANCARKLIEESAGTQEIKLYGPRNISAYASRTDDTIPLHIIKSLKEQSSFNGSFTLLKLESGINFDNKTISPACFFRSEEEPTKPFEILMTVGWHKNASTQDQYRFQENNATDISFKNLTLGQLEDLKLIYIESPNNVACSNGFDGPLVYLHPNGVSYVVGMNDHSFDGQCTVPMKSHRISVYLDWIKQIMAQDKESDQTICIKNVIFY